MRKKLLLGILIIFLFRLSSMGQTENYSVKKAPFSSKKYDEFSPAYYKNGIVFCTNRSPNSFVNYSSSLNKRQFKIYYASIAGNTISGKARLFSKDLKTRLNDGPATFNSGGDTIYYSRNLEVTSNITNLSNQMNKLGIFSAVLVDGDWTKIREFRYNLERYNITAPCLSPDGKRLYFASDKPGGFGGSDLYYCQWTGGYWAEPVNLGPLINTKGNESYPSVNASGDLIFSSDGLPGLGGKDIFFAQFSDTTWLKPISLDPPINSQYDDFGMIANALMNEGYFSSNRNKSIDIYHFKTNFPQVFYSSIQKENQYCFTFRDNVSIVIDTSKLQYRWTFGDGKSYAKAVVSHCFNGPGDYNVKLDIFDRGTGKLFFSKLSYNIVLRDFEQPYINSSDVAVTGEIMEFDGLRSYLPGFTISDYIWNFGDGNRSTGGSVSHSFQKKGEYFVNMELTLVSDSSGKFQKTGISKKVLVLADLKERADYLTKVASVTTELHDLMNFENAKVKTQYNSEAESQQDAVFVIELLSSKSKIDLKNNIFRNVPKKYTIREKFVPGDDIYSYSIDQHMSLMATYPAYMEMMASGFKDVRIKMYVLKDQSEIELHKLIESNGAFADSYFDKSEKLTSNGYVMLDQIVRFMNKYPSVRLEVAVHSDNNGLAGNQLALTQRHSLSFVNYLIKRGINAKRLVATGFGGSKPVANNFLEKDRKLNRRIDFIIIN